MGDKLKCYVLIISEIFSSTHPRAGQLTGFYNSIKHGTKLHTIRNNYDYWRIRVEEINKNKAYLSVRKWTGRPYKSKQRELFRFFNTDGIGIEKLEYTLNGWCINGNNVSCSTAQIAKNDGLGFEDFNNWFRGKITVHMDPMAIIHFTKFRYIDESKG